MLIKRASDIRSSEITDRDVYFGRRSFMTGVAALAATGVLGASSAFGDTLSFAKTAFGQDEKLTALKDVTTYNNYYEFGTDKGDPAQYAGTLITKPWTVTVDGECANPGTLALEDLLKPHALEERIYRHRCVERWSMVIPWIGFPLADLIKRFEPTGNAKFVKFTTLADAKQMPGIGSHILDWPYVEGLRMDEAMNPLTLLAVGLYGETLPNQNGAPLRLVVPWKYGYKSIKSIVKVSFVEQQPKTAWEKYSSSEYGFYSNVNPEVDHPRWSQRKERRIGDFFTRETVKFNGYGDQVAQMYAGMDLVKYH